MKRARTICREIGAPGDPAWDQWLRIYYDAFPANERMTDDYFLEVLREKEQNEAGNKHVLVLCPSDGSDSVLGIAYYEYHDSERLAFLWYIAVQHQLRNSGYGKALYNDLLRRMTTEGADVILFEVEIPEIVARKSRSQASWARRRIDWYRRQGARLLSGVQYWQDVDGQRPPTEMYVMTHTVASATAATVFAAARSIVGDAIRITGPLRLS